MSSLFRFLFLVAALGAGPALADDEMRALHNHTRHARQDVLDEGRRPELRGRHADAVRPGVRQGPRRKLNNSERAAYRLWCQENDECFGVQPQEDLSHLPPGLQKQVERDKPLPAGWEKKLRPGLRIDPQVYAYARPVPRDVLEALPPQPGNTLLVTIDGRLVRIAKSSSIILDVFRLEF